MSSFDEERQSLDEWILREDEKYSREAEEEEEERKYGLRRDSEAGYRFQLSWREYLYRMAVLKKKYGISLSDVDERLLRLHERGECYDDEG